MALITRENAIRTVALLSYRLNDSIQCATGTFVLSKSGAPYLLTAGHFARNASKNTIVELPNGIGKKPSYFYLSDLTAGERVDSAIADLSAYPLIGIKEKDKHLFTSRFLTFTALLGEESKPVDREAELTTLGFPSGLGHDAKGALVPLSFRTHASSNFFYLKDDDYKEPLLLFALESAALGGYSGAPVFDMDSRNNGIVGFIKGNLNDPEGGKMALVTPASFAKYLF